FGCIARRFPSGRAMPQEPLLACCARYRAVVAIQPPRTRSPASQSRRADAATPAGADVGTRPEARDPYAFALITAVPSAAAAESLPDLFRSRYGRRAGS